jgi:hypothetical protein
LPYWEARYDDVTTSISLKMSIKGIRQLMYSSGHNIFDGKSFDNSFYPNPERWFEAG